MILDLLLSPFWLPLWPHVLSTFLWHTSLSLSRTSSQYCLITYTPACFILFSLISIFHVSSFFSLSPVFFYFSPSIHFTTHFPSDSFVPFLSLSILLSLIFSPSTLPLSSLLLPPASCLHHCLSVLPTSWAYRISNTALLSVPGPKGVKVEK